MSTQWFEATLNDVCHRITDGAHASPKSVDRGLPMASVKDMSAYGLNLETARHISAEDFATLVRQGCKPLVGDVLIAKDGATALDTVCVIQRPIEVVLLSSVAILRPKTDVVQPEFLRYYLDAESTRTYMKAAFTTGAAIPRVVLKDFKRARIRYPDLASQTRICAALSAYDDLIENNVRRMSILEEMARRIYEEWFVRFRFPGHEGVRMVESELGLVPEGWRIGTVAEVAVVYRGRSYKGTELADFGGRPFVNLKCMERDGGFRASGLKRYTGQFKESHTVRPGDMVMGITDMTQERRIVARVGRVSGLDADFGVFSMDLVRIASRGQYAEPYLYAMFRWSGFADEVKQHANGANVLHLLPARIEEFAFARPTPELAARFADLFAPMLSLCDKLERKNANLQAARDLLLPKLISGELDVSAMSEPEAIAA